MTNEEKLREMILRRYGSIREFSSRIDIPNSTVESILKRGVQNSSVSNVIKVCKGLNISVEAIAEGRIEHVKPNVKHTTLKHNNTRVHVVTVDSTPKKVDIDKILNSLKKSNEVTLNGQTVKPRDVDSIVDAMTFGIKMVSNRQNEED